jgi:hypothetical protein
MQRRVYHAEALAWLAANPLEAGHAILTSLPDTSEVASLDFEAWQQWFSDVAGRLVAATPADSATIFYQTDIKREGLWVDKSYLVQRGAYAAGGRLLWHKIVCRVPAGTTTFGRPAYAHVLCFSRGLVDDVARSTPDVLPRLGEMTWARAMGREAVEQCLDWLQAHTETRVVVDPFCGRGTALAAANLRGLDAIGVELSSKRAERARRLRLAPLERGGAAPAERPPPDPA